MNASPTIVNLAAALVCAQRNIGGAVKGTANPFFKSRFADLGEIIAVCKAALLDEDIAVSQMPCTLPSGAPGLETILLHASGEWMSNIMPVVCAKEKDPQALGSAVTYARRYALQSALLIPAVDDDGEAAMYRQEQREARDEKNRDSGPQKPVQAPEPEIKANAAPGEIRIHFGKNRGLRLDELTPQQRHWYHQEWLPKKEVNGPTSPEDLALVNALKSYPKDKANLVNKSKASANLETWDGFIQDVSANGNKGWKGVFLLANDQQPEAMIFNQGIADRAQVYSEDNVRVTASVHAKSGGEFEVISLDPVAETGLN